MVNNNGTGVLISCASNVHRHNGWHTYGRPDRCMLVVSLTDTHKQHNTAAEVYIKSSTDQYLNKLKIMKSCDFNNNNNSDFNKLCTNNNPLCAMGYYL